MCRDKITSETITPFIQNAVDRGVFSLVKKGLCRDEFASEPSPAVYDHFCQQGYRCIRTSGVMPSVLTRCDRLKTTSALYSWDQQLILSIWISLHPAEPAHSLLSLLSKWFQTTAQLAPRQRLEHFARDVLFAELSTFPIAIFIDDISPMKGIPLALETLFTWIWQCDRRLKKYDDHPLKFILLGKLVGVPANEL